MSLIPHISPLICIALVVCLIIIYIITSLLIRIFISLKYALEILNYILNSSRKFLPPMQFAIQLLITSLQQYANSCCYTLVIVI